ncbi:hypothetical protein A7U60_g5305 [Sanghuangporus baumii]|uniref:DUF6533 domain-containing protein n=1 Tax=Sanghuangporus baumii TaxID=108892 RepID=A0A9Q5N3U0_SANBA|nr:hypothetical protein A7U60_g5305 [Sanghuangporus baumii]
MSLLKVSRSLKARTDAEFARSKEVAQLTVSLTRTQQYCAVALTTVLVYHSVLTLEKEINYFWRNPRSSVSIIYFANRYIGLLAAVCNMTVFLFSESHASCACSFSFWVSCLAGLVVFFLLDYILLIRTTALFHEHKTLSVALKILLGAEVFISFCLLIYVISIENGPGPILWLVGYTKANYSIVTYSVVESSPFVAIVRSTAGIPILVCTLGSHLFLNLKEAGEKGVNGGTNYTPDISDMDFVENGEGNEESSDRGGSA